VTVRTLDSAGHRQAFGLGGGPAAQSSGLETEPPGLHLLTDGRAHPEARAPLELR
jgi:hypothetical protein